MSETVDNPEIPEGFSFEISRKVWLRGEGIEKSYLLRRTDSKMCCVGICLRALGLPDSALMDKKTAMAVGALHLDEVIWNTNLYQYNDNPDTLPEDREARITNGFAKGGITVTFTD